MTTSQRHAPPSADEIERLFRHPLVVVMRPLLRAGIGLTKLSRRFDWKAEGLERLQSIEAPVVFAANHVSHADTPAILGTLPRHMRRRTAVAAALDVFGSGQGGPHARLKRLLPFMVAAGFHAFAFDRHGPPLRSVRTSVQLIRHGWSLLLYPEGTRSRTGDIGAFKSGVGVLARFTNRPIIPVHVEGGQHVLRCGAFMPTPGRMIVRYGAPMHLERGESAGQFVARLEEEVRRLATRWPKGSAPSAAPRDLPVVTEHSVRNQPA